MSDEYWKQRVAYLSLVAVFVVSDVTDVMAFDFSVWVGIDYCVRCGILSLIFWLVARRFFSLDEIGFAGTRKDILLVHGVILAAASLVFELFVMLPLKGVLPSGFGAVPVPESSFWPGIDRYVGLPLLVVSEEVVFRGIALTVLRKAGLNAVGIVLISAGLFALSYWTHSLRAILAMGVLGIFFMVSTMRTRNVIPAMVAHYLVLWFWR